MQDLDFIRLEKQTFESSPNDSIDYALMEKSDNVVVVPLDAQWSDIGSFSAEMGAQFQVKKLYINPDSKISLQMHKKCAEYWVVVNGTATATNGENVITLRNGESTYIPIGTIHSLENKTRKPLEIIEVQSGAHLGEDDIIRFEDIYGRVENLR